MQPSPSPPEPIPARRSRTKLVVAIIAVVAVAAALLAMLPSVRPTKTVTADAASVLLTTSTMPKDPFLTYLSNGTYPNWEGPGTSAAWSNLQGNYGIHFPLQVKLMLWVASDANLAQAQYSSLVVATPYKTYDLGVQGADAASYFEAYNFTSGGTSSRGLQVVRYNVVFSFYFDSDQAPPYPWTLQAWASAQLQRVETFAH